MTDQAAPTPSPADTPGRTPEDGSGRSPDDRRSRAPVLVVGAHRSGTSATTGLFVLAGGMRIGEPMPPRAANPKGYFESSLVMKAHNDALARLDRDWTCPPLRMDADPLAEELIAAEVQDLAARPGPFGVKDPRLLFMLDLWCNVVEEVRLVGVVRDHESSTRSLVSRDGIRPWHAAEITQAHLRRLRLLREHLPFPIVNFQAPETFLDSARAAGRALGLDWDDDAAREFHDSGLHRARNTGYHANDDVDWLVATQGPDSAPTFRVDEVRAALDRIAEQEAVERGPVTRLSLHGGLQAGRRRRRMWQDVPQDLHESAVELVSVDRIATSMTVAPDDATIHQVRSLDDLLEVATSWSEETRALVVSDLGAWLRPEDTTGFLATVAACLPPASLVLFGTSLADRIHAAQVGRTPLDLTEFATHLQAEFHVVERIRIGHGEWIRALTRDVPRAPVPDRDPELAPSMRDRIDDLVQTRHRVELAARVVELEQDLARTGRELCELRDSTVVRAALGAARRVGPLVRRMRDLRVRAGGQP